MTSLFTKRCLVKRYVVTLLLLVFSGQSLAAIMLTCPAEQASSVTLSHQAKTEKVMPQGMMHHHMTTLQVKSASPAVDQPGDHDDCCKTSDHCMFGSCSLASISGGLVVNLLASGATMTTAYQDKAQQQTAESRYRPPIFR